MFKKLMIAAPLAVVTLTPSIMAFAADSVTHSINIVAHVPSTTFFVVPVDSTLLSTDQNMDYNPATDKMKEVNGYFDMHHTAGSVHASLAAPARLQSGANIIDLKVEVSGKTLTMKPEMVAPKELATINYRAPLKISAHSTKPPAAGDYSGTVALVFDAVLAP